jgi:hypothetical protein
MQGNVVWSTRYCKSGENRALAAAVWTYQQIKPSKPEGGLPKHLEIMKLDGLDHKSSNRSPARASTLSQA